MPTKRVADMTPEEYEAHKIKRRLEAKKYKESLSPEEAEARRVKYLKQQKAKRNAASPEEKKAKEKKKYRRRKAKLATLPPEEQAKIREETNKQNQERRRNDPDYNNKQKHWRKNQSDEVRKNRLDKARIKEAKKRAAMTEEEKKANRKYKREYNAERRKTDPASRAMCDIRSRLRHVRKRRHLTRTDLKTSEMLGCTWKEFADFIESQFDERMTWENKGRYTWHLDHVIPLAYFDLSKPDEEKVASNVLNHQPMWHDENMKKGATMPPVSSIPQKLWRMALELDADFAKREPRASK